MRPTIQILPTAVVLFSFLAAFDSSSAAQTVQPNASSARLPMAASVASMTPVQNGPAQSDVVPPNSPGVFPWQQARHAAPLNQETGSNQSGPVQHDSSVIPVSAYSRPGSDPNAVSLVVPHPSDRVLSEEGPVFPNYVAPRAVAPYVASPALPTPALPTPAMAMPTVATQIQPNPLVAQNQDTAENDTRLRLGQLEAETNMLREKLAILESNTVRSGLPTLSDEAGDVDFITQAQLRAAMKRNAWRKGDFTFTPYGFLMVSTVYETARSVPGEIILWVQSADVREGDAFYIDPKSSRLGLDIGGPKVCFFDYYQMSGRFEVDFQGNYLQRNKGTLLFRQGYINFANKNSRILLGQTWDVISPLFPGTLNYIPGCAAGNIGYRRPQIRYERYHYLSSKLKWTNQLSGNLAVPVDFATDPTCTCLNSGWPVLEGRTAITWGHREGPCALPKELGLYGHIGENEYLVDRPGLRDTIGRRTWCAGLDFKYPINQRTTFSAECFMGETLATFFGGVFQGINLQNFDPIRTYGGWVDLKHLWTDRFFSHIGFCLDDPINSDLTYASGRIYNHQGYVNWNYMLTKTFRLGFEVSLWKTLYKDLDPGESTRFDFMAKWSF